MHACPCPRRHRAPSEQRMRRPARPTPPPAAHARRIRDLNDEINKLIREKGHWERRIVELGGPDYSKSAPKVADSKGQEVAELTGGVGRWACTCRAPPSLQAHGLPALAQAHKELRESCSLRMRACARAGKGAGYRYFGAAKALPGVKELFEAEPPKLVRWAHPHAKHGATHAARMRTRTWERGTGPSARAACTRLTGWARWRALCGCRCARRGTRCTRPLTRTTTASGTRRMACWRAWRARRSG